MRHLDLSEPHQRPNKRGDAHSIVGVHFDLPKEVSAENRRLARLRLDTLQLACSRVLKPWQLRRLTAIRTEIEQWLK